MTAGKSGTTILTGISLSVILLCNVAIAEQQQAKEPQTTEPQSTKTEPLSEAKKSRIRELMEITGALSIGQMLSEAFTSQMTEGMRRANPNLPEKAFTILAEEVSSSIEEELVVKGTLFELTYPIYHRHMSQEDIEGLIAFYKTPLGRKTVAVLPQLTRESMQVGQHWGASLGPIIEQRVRKRFQEEGITIPGRAN